MNHRALNFIQKLVTNSSKEGDVCLDLFSGSGTLAEACINTNRHFIVIEKDPVEYEKGKNRILNIIGLDTNVKYD